MAFPSTHYLFSFGGLLGTAEAWTMGLRFRDLGGFNFSQEDEEAVLLEMATKTSTAWSNLPTTNRVKLTWAKWNLIGTDGKYVRDYTNVYDYPAPVARANASVYPNQVALVTTLETGAARGLAHRGRLFWPIPVQATDAATGLVSVANVESAAAGVATWLDALNDNTYNLRAYVMSAVGAGAARPITGVSVGRVLDTMRSRRTQLDEERSTAALAAVP